MKRTGCDVWHMECQASNITVNVQSDHILHGYMLPVSFATDQLHRPLRCAKFQPMYNKTLQLQTLPQLVRIADWYSIRVKK